MVYDDHFWALLKNTILISMGFPCFLCSHRCCLMGITEWSRFARLHWEKKHWDVQRLSKFLRLWMGQCQSSEENLWSPEAAFFLFFFFLLCLILACDHLTQITLELFLLLNKFFLFVPQVFPGWSTPLEDSRSERVLMYKWQSVGSPRLLTCLFFLHQLYPEILLTTEKTFLSSKLKLSWIKNHYFTKKSFK